MGLGSSKESLSALYAQYAREAFADKHGSSAERISGGAEGFVGGLESLSGYETSIMSQAKRQMIRDIAADLTQRLKVPGVNPSGKSLDQIIDALRKTIPDPRRKGSARMTTDKKSQEQTCRVLGQVINERMGNTVINMNDPPAKICDQVAETMYSLFSGIHGEFVAVRDDVKRLVGNLDTLQTMLEKNFSAIEGRLGQIQHEEDANIAGPTKALRKFHHDLLTELKRQRSMLANMTDSVIKKSDHDLAELLKESGDFKTLVKKIKAGPGTDGFSEKLAGMLQGVRTVAESANEVEQALKKLGVSHAEYAKLKKSKDLKRFLNKSLTEKLDSPEGLLREYIKASNAVYNRHYLHDDIVKSLSGRRTGSSEGGEYHYSSDEENREPSDDSVSGGAVSGGLKLDKRVRKREELRRDLLRAFNQQMGGLYNDMSSSVKAIAGAIGAKKVDLSDETEDFIRALELLPDIGKKYTYFALTGYHDDIRAKEERERFLASAKYLHEVTDSLLRKPGFSGIAALGDLKKSLQGLVDLIGRFYKRFSEGFGILEAGVKSKPDASGAGPNMHLSEGAKRKMKDAAGKAVEVGVEVAKSQYGAAEGGAVGDLEMIYGKPFKMAQINRVAYDFRAAKDSLIYDFRTAKIRSNLVKLPAERKSFSEDYTRIVGDAIAKAVDDVNSSREAFNNTLKENEPLYTAIVTEAGRDKSLQTSRLREVGKFANEMFDAKVSMYRTAEAIEHYMNAFSDGVAAHPDDLQDVVGMLNNVEIISKWHNEESGDAVISVFEVFPGSYNGLDAKYSKINKAKIEGHYYQKVANICQIAPVPVLAAGVEAADEVQPGQGVGLPGNPFLAVPSYKTDTHNDAQTVMEYMDKALQVNPLKNVVSIFINIGAKFGNTELIKKTHMSPIQIYRALLNYIKYSSLAMGVQYSNYENDSRAPLYEADTGNIAAVMGNNLTYKGNGNVQLAPTGNDTLNANLQNLPAVAQPAPPINPDQVIGDLGNANSGKVRLDTYVSMAGVGKTARDSAMKMNDFAETDKLYQMCVKSMVSKVLTAIGVFNMLNRPINEDGLGFYSGLRLVLGGDETRVPQVIPEAMELYIRLPLLAEFYRKIFNFDVLGQPDFRAISLVPEMSGIFSGVINIVFDRAKYVTEGNYGESDTRALVEEINKIWNKFRSSKNPTNDILDEFIAEVNRRYGILHREEREEYINERDSRYNSRYQNYSKDAIEDFELSGLDEDDDYSRPAPSQSYQTKFAASGQAADHKYSLSLSANEEMLRELRMAIDGLFKKAKKEQQRSFPDNVSTAPISFGGTIRARKQELKSAQSDEEKYKVVSSAINGFGAYALSAIDKSIIMFHETVVNGITTLGAVKADILKFKIMISAMNRTLEQFDNWWEEKTTRNLPLFDGNLNATIVVNDYPDLHAAILQEFKSAAANPGDIIVRAGNQGANANVTVGNFVQFVNNMTPDNRGKVKEVAMRFMINQDNMFIQLFETIYTHTRDFDKLVESDIQTVRDQSDELCAININISHSGLVQEIKSQISNISSVVDKMRGLLPKKIIKIYEKYTDIAAENTLYNLEKFLVNEIIYGRTDNPVHKGDPLDNVNAKIANITKYLTKPWNFNAQGLNAAGAVNTNAAVTNWLNNRYSDEGRDDKRVRPLLTTGARGDPQLHSRQEFYGPMLYLISYNPLSAVRRTIFTGVNTDITGAANAGARTGNMFSLLGNNSGNIKQGVAIDKTWSGVANVMTGIYSQNWETWDLNNTYQKSVWLSFNKLVAGYIKVIYDNSLGRVYSTTLDKFANGAFSSAVFNEKWYPDTAGAVFEGSVALLKDSRGVLFRSLALMIRQLVSEPTFSGDAKQYIESDLAEIPLYMKERMKANLPVMRKLFHLLSQRCDLLQKFAHGLNIQYTDARTVQAAHMSNRESTTQAIAVLDEVNRGCRSIITCINETLSELNDDPKFMQLRENFIEEYKAANGYNPFMPMSSLTYFIQNDPSPAMAPPLGPAPPFPLFPAPRGNATEVLYPIHKPGDDKFKMLYGARGIINSDPELKDLPGMIDILKAHNQSTNERHSISESDLASYVKGSLRLLRYVLNNDKYKVMLSSPAAYNDDINLVPDQAHNTFQSNNATTLSDVIALTESAFQKDQRQSITTYLQNIKNCDDYVNMSRDAIIAYNIIDINKVPINFAALMREMPMVNLHNYSYTFDCLVMELLGLQKADIDQITKTNSPYSITVAKLLGNADAARPGQNLGLDADPNHTAARLMGLMLMFPYDEITKDVYDLYVSRIIRGDMGIEGLGRPAYLGDELYNKALFGEVYPGSDLYEEQGPSVVNPRTRYPPRPLQANDTYGPTSAYNANTLNNHGDTLSFMDPKDNGHEASINSIRIDGYKPLLQVIGRMRFDTKFTRNLFWITNIQRILRLRLRRDLTWFDTKIVSEHAVLAPGITEQYGNQNGPLYKKFMH